MEALDVINALIGLDLDLVPIGQGFCGEEGEIYRDAINALYEAQTKLKYLNGESDD